MSAKTSGAYASKNPPAAASSQAQGDIRFDPRRLMAGLVFHACESGKVDEVSASSIRMTMRRLVRQRVAAVMERPRWAQLSNAQRMQWLLKVTHTDFEAASEGYGVFKEHVSASKR